MKKKNQKNAKIGVGIFVAIIIIIGIVTYDDPVPNVKFTDASKSFLNAKPGDIVTLKVNVENFEQREIDGAKIVTTLDNPEPNYIQILDSEIELGKLILDDKSGEESIEIKIFQSIGTKLSFTGKSEIQVENYTTNTKHFEITIQPLDEPTG